MAEWVECRHAAPMLYVPDGPLEDLDTRGCTVGCTGTGRTPREVYLYVCASCPVPRLEGAAAQMAEALRAANMHVERRHEAGKETGKKVDAAFAAYREVQNG